MMKYLQVILSFMILFSSSQGSQDWTYEHQELWPKVYCQRALSQSPIDLKPETMANIKASPLVFSNWDQEFDATITNVGDTVKVTFPSSARLTLSGGGYPGTYNVVNFHFHWSAEHTVNGQRLALEQHFVAYNDKFESAAEAKTYTYGITVLTVFYDYCEQENNELQPIIKQLGKITSFNQSTKLRVNPAVFIPNDVSQFYRYAGSSTTPNCTDNVDRTIFPEYRKVTKNQVDKFRTIKTPQGVLLTENHRQIQPLNGRTVFKISTN